MRYNTNYMSVQKFASKITSKRESHKQRLLIIRIVVAIFGFALFMAGLPFLVIFPEAGIPLVLFGLMLLSLEFAWAGSALLWFSKGVDAVIAWYKRLPKPIRLAVEAFFIVLTIWLIYLLVR